MAESYHEVEDRIDDAIDALNDAEYPNIARTAREFDVPEQRLRRRFKGVQNKIQCGGKNKKLNKSQELALCHYLDRLDESGVSARPQMLYGAANSILKRTHTDSTTPPLRVSKDWTLRFLQRHPKYTMKKRKPLSVLRKLTHDKEAIQGHFEQFCSIKAKYGILEDDIYNMDETGFRIGVGRAHKVIVRKKNAQLPSFIEDPDNRESLTSIECVGANGTLLPPILVLALQTLSEATFVDELPPNYLIACSETGYSNADIHNEWIRYFDKSTKAGTKGAYRMLISDGFNSHLEFEFVQYCWDNSIIPFCLPPHSTHLLQPLDVVCFQPLKHYHTEAIDHAVRLGDYSFSRATFLATIHEIRMQAFKNSTILSAFRETGLVPYNPNVVLAKLPSPPAVSDSESDSEWPALDLAITPKKVHEVAQFAEIIQKEIEVDSDTELILNKFIKGAMARVQSGAQAEADLERTIRAEAARTARAKATRRTVQKGGIVTVERAKERIRLRTAREQESWEKKEYTRRECPKRERSKVVRFHRAISAYARLRISAMDPEDQLHYQLSDIEG